MTGILGAVAGMGVLGLAGCTSPGSAARATPGAPELVAHVSDGSLKGTVSQGVREFLGVPYAAPPVHDLRFAPPRPAQPWSGVRPATAQGPACIQFQPMGVRNNQATSEDCLYLDIYTPPTAHPGDNLPVVFWMHGGNFTEGTGVAYGGQRFTSLTNSIFVSINYRLGAYGYLALPQFGDGSGDYGLLDQIAALKWVRSNIAAFGGNAHGITIDGQSAGSGSVCDILASPMAAGLFQRAILESGSCAIVAPTSLSEAQALGALFAGTAGCGQPAAAVTCLRNGRTPNLVAAAQRDVINAPAYGTPALPLPPTQAIASGQWNKVPVIIGTVRSEGKLFFTAQARLTAAQYTAAIDTRYGPSAAAILSHYPVSSYPSPFYARAAVFTDSLVACPSYWSASQFGSQVPTWEEEFDDPTSPTGFASQPPGIDMSNAHSAELAYLWNFTLVERPLTATELRLGEQMDRYWGAFARTANPNVPGQVAWPKVTAATHPVISFHPAGNTVSTTGFPAEHQCDFWATIEPGLT
ncbi:MAG TPA: carboxylesterase family protein [Streptosporangiaceae bacterium]